MSLGRIRIGHVVDFLIAIAHVSDEDAARDGIDGHGPGIAETPGPYALLFVGSAGGVMGIAGSGLPFGGEAQDLALLAGPHGRGIARSAQLILTAGHVQQSVLAEHHAGSVVAASVLENGKLDDRVHAGDDVVLVQLDARDIVVVVVRCDVERIDPAFGGEAGMGLYLEEALFATGVGGNLVYDRGVVAFDDLDVAAALADEDAAVIGVGHAGGFIEAGLGGDGLLFEVDGKLGVGRDGCRGGEQSRHRECGRSGNPCGSGVGINTRHMSSFPRNKVVSPRPHSESIGDGRFWALPPLADVP